MTRRAATAAATATPEVCFDLWDKLPPDRFLTDDRHNPARALAAGIVRKEVARLGGSASLLELGPGPGFDYADHFSAIAGLEYSALEGSKKLLAHCTQRFPQADFQLGGFLALQRRQERSIDIVYAKAVFEHQASFQEPLRSFLRVARSLALINWYLPPGPTAQLRYNEQERMHYNRYAAGAVLKEITDAGFALEIRIAPPPGNALYICRHR